MYTYIYIYVFVSLHICIAYRVFPFSHAHSRLQGWTSLTLVAKFNRMRELTRDYEFVVECAQNSSVVELSQCGYYVRRRDPLPSPKGRNGSKY